MKIIKICFLIFTLFSHLAYGQSKNIIQEIHDSVEGCSFYEVSEEMFEAISEDERFKEHPSITEIKYLMFVECENDRIGFYQDFTSKANLKEYNILMRSKSPSEQFAFFRKKDGDLKEYLLIHDQGLTYLVTTLNISTINELQGYMRMVGSLGRG